MVNLNKHAITKSKHKVLLNQHANLRTVRMFMRIVVYNCRPQYSSEQFWLLSVQTMWQTSKIGCCLFAASAIASVIWGSAKTKNRHLRVLWMFYSAFESSGTVPGTPHENMRRTSMA